MVMVMVNDRSLIKGGRSWTDVLLKDYVFLPFIS